MSRAQRRRRSVRWPDWIYTTFTPSGIGYLERSFEMLKTSGSFDRASKISADDLAAMRCRYLAPCSEYLLGGADGLVVLGLARRTHACQQTARGRIERVNDRTATLQELAASSDAADRRARLEAKRGQDLGDA